MSEYYSLAHELRKKQGLTLQEFGKKVGVCDSSIAYYEKGERTPPVDVAERIAEALNYRGKLSRLFWLY